MSARQGIDWEGIGREFRAGQLSVREIGRQFSVSAQGILKKAKQNGWTRDLTDQFRHAVKAKLERHDAESARSAREDRRVDAAQVDTTVDSVNARVRVDEAAAIVEAASERGFQVQMGHRAGARRGLGLVEQLKGELKMATERLEEVVQAINAETADDATKERRKNMLRAVSLPIRAGVLRDLAQAESKYVQLERQAHNLDDQAPSEHEYEARLRRLAESMER